jgi:hypothetical protein
MFRIDSRVANKRSQRTGVVVGVTGHASTKRYLIQWDDDPTETAESGRSIEVIRIQRNRIKTTFCVICRGECDSVSCIMLACQENHEFCTTCLIQYARSVIGDGYIAIRCPGWESCENFIKDSELRTFLPPDLLKKWNRFRKLHKNPNFSECPNCHYGFLGQAENPIHTCSRCGEIYCFFHSNAHPPNMSCREYEERLLVSDAPSFAVIEDISRKCPTCGIPTEKTEGCNNMMCGNCKTVVALSRHS